MEKSILNKRVRKAEEQLSFCSTLMNRLYDEFKHNSNDQLTDPEDRSNFIKYKHRYTEDIKRLRRELSTLMDILSNDKY